MDTCETGFKLFIILLRRYPCFPDRALCVCRYMNQSNLHNYLYSLQVSALSNTAPASDVQFVASHLQAIMPLHTASVSERFKRQVQNESGTNGDQPPPPPPPPPPQPMHAKYLKVGYLAFDVLNAMPVMW